MSDNVTSYTQDAADALVSIRDAGRQGVLRRLTRTVSLGTVVGVTSAGGIIDMVVLSVSKGDPLDDSLNEALTQGRLRKLLVAAASAPFQPKSVDVVLFEGAYWTVHGCTQLKPATVPLLYTLIVEDTDLTGSDIAALELTAEEEVAAS